MYAVCSENILNSLSLYNENHTVWKWNTADC